MKAIANILVSFALILTASAAAQGYSKSETIEYYDDLGLWVTGQVKRTTTNGLETARTDYNAKAQPYKTYAFDALLQTFTYNIDGSLATTSDGRDGASGAETTVTYSSWKRGIPQSIKYPATPEAQTGATRLAVVGDDSTIESVSDENAFVTSYTYDAMGRLISVSYPAGDSVAWKPMTQVFEVVGTIEYGISAGHWRQTVATGNAMKVTYFDALWRPLLVREYDVGDVAGTQRFTRYTYDHEGRVTFASYPSTSSTPTTGIWSEYDALGRVSSISQDSEQGLLTTRTEYLPGFKTRVTNPRNESVTTEYMVFDQPTTEWPVLIQDSAGRKTQIDRDVFGKPRALVRSGSGQ